MQILRSPGPWLFTGSLELPLLVCLAEFLCPGCSVSQDHIHELGVGPTASRLIFVFALVMFGLMVLWASFLLRQRAEGKRVLKGPLKDLWLEDSCFGDV